MSSSASPLTLVLEPANDTFITKRIKLSDIPVKIGRTTNRHSTPLESNGYFDSKVLSRTHAEVWCDNGKGDPVELRNHDNLEFGIDIINEQDHRLMFRKVAAVVYINSSNGEVPSGHVIKSGSNYKRRPRLSVFDDPEGSIYASLESELHCARDENRRLAEISNILNDMSNKFENKNNRTLFDDKSLLLRKIEETEAKFQAHLEKCEPEKTALTADFTSQLDHAAFIQNEYDEKLQLYEKKVRQLEDNLKSIKSQNPVSDQVDDLKQQVQELTQLLEYTQDQLQSEQIFHSEQEEKLQCQIIEMVSQLNSSREKLDELQHLHNSEIVDLKQKINDSMSQLNDARSELKNLQLLYSSDVDKFNNQINDLVSQLDKTKNDLEITQNRYKVEIEALKLNSKSLDCDQSDEYVELDTKHKNIVSELCELKLNYKQTVEGHEDFVSKLNEDHKTIIASKDDQINKLKDERTDLSIQLSNFKDETRNTLDTVKQQLVDSQNEISHLVKENKTLSLANSDYLKKISTLEVCLKDKKVDDIEVLKVENDNLKLENAKIKAELCRWQNENQSEFEKLVREEVSKRLGAESSKSAIYRRHHKQESTTKDSEWTDSENVEERSRNVTETSNRKNDDNFRSLFITGTISIIAVSLGVYLFHKLQK
ncbi:13805_t:CDS:2 [Gigaspora rosea]|nr:13805_t:CDS:2 [Gigaspora rosea]